MPEMPQPKTIETSDELSQRLDELLSFIRATEAEAKQGHNVDLTGLDDRIDEVCKAAENINTPETRQLLGNFDALLHAFDELAATMRQEQFEGDQTDQTNQAPQDDNR